MIVFKCKSELTLNNSHQWINTKNLKQVSLNIDNRSIEFLKEYSYIIAVYL